MRAIFYVFICLFLIGTSCKKDKYHTIVKGKVINAGSKQPIDSVLVVMRDGIASGGGWFALGSSNTSSDKKSYTYTDKNGCFEIELKGEHFAYIGFSKKQYTYKYHQEGTYIGYKPIPDGEFENEVFEMEADAWFNPVIKSREFAYSTDSIFFEILCRTRSASEIANGDKYGEIGFDHHYYGSEPFSYSYQTVGDMYQPYRITLRRHNTKKVIIDSVYIKSFQVYRDTIYY